MGRSPFGAHMPRTIGLRPIRCSSIVQNSIAAPGCFSGNVLQFFLTPRDPLHWRLRPSGNQLVLRKGAFKPANKGGKRILMGRALRQMFVQKQRTRAVFRRKVHPVADALALAFAEQVLPHRPDMAWKERELDARGAGVRPQQARGSCGDHAGDDPSRISLHFGPINISIHHRRTYSHN